MTWSEIPYEKSVSPSLNGVKMCEGGLFPSYRHEKVNPGSRRLGSSVDDDGQQLVVAQLVLMPRPPSSQRHPYN